MLWCRLHIQYLKGPASWTMLVPQCLWCRAVVQPDTAQRDWPAKLCRTRARAGVCCALEGSCVQCRETKEQVLFGHQIPQNSTPWSDVVQSAWTISSSHKGSHRPTFFDIFISFSNVLMLQSDRISVREEMNMVAVDLKAGSVRPGFISVKSVRENNDEILKDTWRC